MTSPVTHWQILARDPDRAAAFYAELFGWRVDAANALGYRTVDTGRADGLKGGIWPAPPDAHAFVQLFVEIDDVADAVARAEALGGRVVIPPQRLPEGDEMAVVLDVEGIPFGLWRKAGGGPAPGVAATG